MYVLKDVLFIHIYKLDIGIVIGNFKIQFSKIMHIFLSVCIKKLN